MKRKRKELPDWDDGRTIAPMNVDGMPWSRTGRMDSRSDTNAAAGSMPEQHDEGVGPGMQSTSLTREESRYYTWGALKAALMVVGVICGGLVLFIAFCVWVWFR